MKKFRFQLICAVIFGFLMPWMIMGFRQNHQTEDATASTDPTFETFTNQPVMIRVIMDGSPVEMELEEYLVGVVLREMPVDFEMEAQKAQAVVARTYALRTCEKGSKHDGHGGVCTDSSCCQAYWEPEDYLTAGGDVDALEKVKRAVEETAGQVLTYEGKLIDATYFSCSGGMTEDAAAVWGSDIPYLQSTESPGEEQATHYTDTVTFTKTEFQEALGVKLKGQPAHWLGQIVRTDGGGVETMVIGDVSYKGTTLRKLLQLRSTAFTMTAVVDTITVTTKGYGHRVGMSQYGAEAMAVSGSTYEQILYHYYQSTALEYN